MLESVKDSNFMLGMQALAQLWLLTDKSWIQSNEFISLIKIIQETDRNMAYSKITKHFKSRLIANMKVALPIWYFQHT